MRFINFPYNNHRKKEKPSISTDKRIHSNILSMSISNFQYCTFGANHQLINAGANHQQKAACESLSNG